MIETFYEIIKEAKDGKVMISNDPFPIGFNTIIEEDNLEYTSDSNISVLIIKDKAKFFKLLKEYLDLVEELDLPIYNFLKKDPQNKMKFIISHLFVNATTEDFIDPINFLRNRLSFLKDNTFSYLDKPYLLKTPYFNSYLEIKRVKQHLTMETPYRIEISFIEEKDGKTSRYKLPEISYGITSNGKEKSCYIYSLLDKEDRKSKDKEELSFKKHIARLLYKINSGVPKEKQTVSPSAVLSLNIFLSLLEHENIRDILCVPYLPLRFLGRNIEAEDKDNKDELLERNLKIQYNITNKFVETFERLCFHISNLEITSYPYTLDEFLHLTINRQKKEINNDFLNITSNLKK